MTGGKAGGGYLDSLSMFGIKPGLEATAELMRRVGNPEKELPFLHIAGTNGKRSTGAMLECMLRGAGFTTGFYTSPHLVDIRERFRVNGIAVSEEDYAAFSAELAAAARAGGPCGAPARLRGAFLWRNVPEHFAVENICRSGPHVPVRRFHAAAGAIRRK